MEVLKQRGRIYGNFDEQARISQQLKTILNISDIEDYTLREGLEMIAHKLARIANGNPFYIDNYKDIAGYAKLIADYLENRAEQATDSVVKYKEKVNGEWQWKENI